ncbi:hypothetical protein DWF04_022710 [Cereibacter sphaeroides f. sp. denitrificans]
MKILRPIKITDSHLVSCSIPETDYPAWSAATTYARGAFVISPTTHTVYRSLQDGNLNHDPDLEQLALADPLIDDPDPVQWQIISATNRWRLFDRKPSVRATAAEAITVELAPGVAIAGVAGFEISAAKVRVTMTEPSLPRRNLLTWTDDWTNAAWTATEITVAAAGGAFRLVPTMLSSSHQIASSAAAATAGQVLTASVDLRADGYKRARVSIGGAAFSTANFAFIDLETGSVTLATNMQSVSVTSLGDGWFRVSASALATATGVGRLVLYVVDASDFGTWSGNGVDGILARRPQVEAGLAATDYQFVNAADVWDRRVYVREIAMQDETVISDWYSYFFEPITELSEFVLVDLPPYANAVVEVEAIRAGGEVSVGQIVLGPVWAIGSTAVKGTGFQGVDFSYVEQDEFGDLTTVRRAATRLSTFEVWVDNAQLLGLDARLRGLRGGTAAVWVGDTDARKAAMNYGFYRGYRSAYQTDGHSLMQIEVQGIV